MDQKHKQKISSGMVRYWDKHRKPTLQKNGYLTITVGNKKKYVHRVVMEEYINRPLRREEQVHHINGDKTDNRIENLEIVSLGEHQRIHSKVNNFGKSRKGVSPTNKTADEKIKLIVSLREQGYLQREIVDLTGISYPTVNKYCKGVVANGN